VTPVYNPPDPSIARQQAERLRASLAYVSAVRSDVFATRAEAGRSASHARHPDAIETANQLLQLTTSIGSSSRMKARPSSNK
jgi:hypothetical protein